MTRETVITSRESSWLEFMAPIRSSLWTATGTIAAATAVCKLGAAYKDVIVASKIGIGPDLDSFLLAMLPTMAMTALMAGSFSPALVPELVRIREWEGPIAGARFAASALTATVALSLLAAFVGYLLRAPLAGFLAPGFPRPMAEVLTFYIVLLLPLVVLTNGGVACSAVLNSRSCFLLPAIAPALTVAVTIFLLLASPPGSAGAVLLCKAALVGALLETGVLAFTVRRVIPAIGSLSLADFFAFGALKSAAADCFILSLSTAAMTVTTLITQSAASRYGAGQVAALTYGSKIPGLLITIALTAIGGAILPQFSIVAARGDWDALRNALRKYARYSLKITLPLTAVLIAFSPQIISLLFQRGRFSMDDTVNVAAIQRMYLLQVPFVIPGLLAVRVLTVIKATWGVFSVAVLNVFTCAVGVHFFGHLFGAKGLALAISGMYAVAAFSAFALVHFEFKRRNCR